MTSLPIEAIVIGDRVRRDMGDIKALAESMQRHGLLHPVVVLKDNTLVAGQRRVAAAGLLGWEEVPVTVVDVSDLLTAERDENEARKDFTPTEAVAIARLVEGRHKDMARGLKSEQAKVAGMISRAKATGSSRELPVMPRSEGPSRDIAARAVGMSGTTYERARAVVVAAEKDPAAFGDLPTLMDETKNIAGAHREMERRKAGTNGRSAVHYKAPYPKPNREMERGLITLEGLVSGFKLIALDQLEETKKMEWGKRLKAAALFLNRLSKEVGRQE